MEMGNPSVFSNLRLNLGYSGLDHCFSLATIGFVRAAMSSKYKSPFLKFENHVTKLIIVY